MKLLFGSLFGITGGVFLLIAIIFIPIAVGAYYFDQYSTQGWIAVQGTVTGITESETTGSDPAYSPYISYCPTVRFATTNGEEIEEDLNECATPAEYATGDSIQLLYNPANPNEVQIKGGVKSTLAVIFEVVFGLLGGLFCIGGVGLIVAAIVAATWRTKTPSAIG